MINQPFIPPDLRFYIDISVKTSLARATQGAITEPYDLKFLKQVRMGYLALASKQGYIIINGECPISKVDKNIVFEIKSRIKEIF